MALSIRLSSKPLIQGDYFNFIEQHGSPGRFICRGVYSNNLGAEKIFELNSENREEIIIEKFRQIAEDSIHRFRLKDVLIHQRIGKVDSDETTLVMAFSAGDPDDAYQACKFAVHRLQSLFPYWKKEVVQVSRFAQMTRSKMTG